MLSRLFSIKSDHGFSRKFTESGCRINAAYKLLRAAQFHCCDVVIISIGINNIKVNDKNAVASLKQLIKYVSIYFFQYNKVEIGI